MCEACTSGREFDCNDRTIWGFQTGPLWGGFAQYTHLPEVNVAKIPENVSYEDASAISMVGMTAWHMLVGRAEIEPGQTVLIMGAQAVLAWQESRSPSYTTVPSLQQPAIRKRWTNLRDWCR